METYYLSLCQGLVGYFVKFLAPNESAVRQHATKYFGKLWCSVYTESYFHEVLRRRHGTNKTKVANSYQPIVVNEDGELL